MSVRSFLVHVTPGAVESVAVRLRAEPACDVFLASNRDVLLIVTDHDGREAERAFDERLAELHGIASVALVSGYDE